MVRAFLESFPEAVMLSGGQPNLQLLGINGRRITIDPERLLDTMVRSPAVLADLRRVDLGTVHELLGTFYRVREDASSGDARYGCVQ